MRSALATLAAGLCLAGAAQAHIQLSAPIARNTEQKDGPCGKAGGQRGDRVTVFEPGQTITVVWTETINHPGHFRISFDDDGQDDFYVPTGFNDVVTDGSDPTILLDDIADKNGGEYRAEVTLPDIECENCTLQVIQVMADKPPYDVTGYFATGNDLYYQCADLSLRRTGGGGGDAGGGGSDAGRRTDLGTTADAGGSAEPEDDGCAVRGGSGTGDLAPWALGLLGLALRRRRRG